MIDFVQLDPSGGGGGVAPVWSESNTRNTSKREIKDKRPDSRLEFGIGIHFVEFSFCPIVERKPLLLNIECITLHIV